ncbi:peptidoglycan-binding protein [Streptomyces sp. NPDC059491]|uniref:peptidoglycan-binding protein n=1 Tax=Streptomyces sp. NPDC059491 TaxID=3346850 RepID=UPI003679D10C
MKRSLTRVVVSTAAAIGIAAGTLALATPGMAATPAAPRAAAVSASAVNNLGLTQNQAKGVQCFLDGSIYGNFVIDGYLGTESWKGIQRWLNNEWGQNLSVDGEVGPQTIKGLQHFLKNGGWGYTGALDGVAGAGTQAAFARFGTSTYGQFC